MTDKVRAMLPQSWREKLPETFEEIRLRVGQRPTARTAHGETALSSETVTPSDVQAVLNAATARSRYAVGETLKAGFVTLPNGWRLGVCGVCVCDENGVRTIRDLTSLCIRAARACVGVGTVLHRSTLILGPPGCGKTTLLRDCVRILSDMGRRVGLVDERGEVAACEDGSVGFAVGKNTDILTGCPKAEGMMMLLRTMAPEWIAVDEITRPQDVDAMVQASYCGVNLLATAHADSAADLYRRPVYRKMMDEGLFADALVMRRDHTYERETLCERSSELR